MGKFDRTRERGPPPSLRPRRSALRAWDSRDPCLLACNALRCNALQMEKSYGGAS
jgi:hypothetical protein